jgi:hypothetical protein
MDYQKRQGGKPTDVMTGTRLNYTDPEIHRDDLCVIAAPPLPCLNPNEYRKDIMDWATKVFETQMAIWAEHTGDTDTTAGSSESGSEYEGKLPPISEAEWPIIKKKLKKEHRQKLYRRAEIARALFKEKNYGPGELEIKADYELKKFFEMAPPPPPTVIDLTGDTTDETADEPIDSGSSSDEEKPTYHMRLRSNDY